MGYTYSFMDNETYGADDINAAISRLTTAGVIVCPTDENLISAMNSVVAEAATDGVEYNIESCKVIKTDEGELKILSGTAFFEDGVSMVIDSEGITLPMQKGCYVYLCHEVESNSCYGAAAAELPAERYVLLAEVDDAGVITDRRKFAQSKLAPGMAPAFFEITNYFRIEAFGKPDEYVIAELNVGHPNYTYVGFRNTACNTMGIAAFGEDGFTDYMKVMYDRSIEFRFEKAGNTVVVHVRRNGVGTSECTLEITVF